MEYIFPAVNVCSDPFGGPTARTNTSFFLSLIWTEEIISTPKINIFWPNSPSETEKLPLLSNPVP